MSRTTRFRTAMLGVLVVAVIAGCGGSDRAGQAGDGATAAVVEAGPGAAFAPADSLVYIHADKRSEGWQKMAPLLAGLDKLELQPGGLGSLALLLTGYELEPTKILRTGFVGDSAFVIISNEPDAESSELQMRYLAYDEISDHAVVDSWMAKDFRPTGEDGRYKLYAHKENSEWVVAVSDRIMLTALSADDLHAAIARGADGRGSLAEDPDFRAALARDHDADAVITGYSRGDLAGAFTYQEGGDLLGPTTALGLTKTAFSAGPSDKGGFWVHAHPAATADGYPAAAPFEPTLFKRVSKGTVVYVGLNDVGGQLPQLARLYDLASGAKDLHSGGLPGWLAEHSGVSVEEMKLFLKGEQAWWWGTTSGVAFRPEDTDAAFAAVEQATKHYGADLGSDYAVTKASRDGDVVMGTSRYQDQDKPPPADPDATLADDPGFGDFLDDAGFPDEVSLVVYADPRPLRSWGPENGEREKSVIDLFDRVLIWTTPVEGGYDLAFYGEPSALAK